MTGLVEGTVFAGRYRIVRAMAVGGMGAVYEAVHLETDRRRALKVMHPHLFQSDEMRERFKREARISARVESEFIVDVSDAGVDEATKMPFLVMELLRGEELGARLKRLGRLAPIEALTYLEQTAWALDKTHAASIIHRDLKPENLFVTQREDGSMRIKILDFGVAKVIAEGATGAGVTRSLGTPLYMAPEQFRSAAKLTGAADVYALGMMAYTLLVGEPYWSQEAQAAGDLIAFVMTAIHGAVEPPVTRAALRGVTLPPPFDGWFARVTAPDPADRFPTASMAVRALREAMQPAASAPLLLGASAPAKTPITPITPITPMRPMTPISATPISTTPISTTPIGSFTPTPGWGSGSRSGPGLRSSTVTLPNTAVTHAPSRSGRGSWIALLSMIGVGALVVGAWAALRTGSPGSASASTTSTASSVAESDEATTASALPSDDAELPPPIEAPSPAASASASAITSASTITSASAPATPPVTAHPSTAPPTRATAKPKPAAGRPPPVSTSTRGPLLGRD